MSYKRTLDRLATTHRTLVGSTCIVVLVGDAAGGSVEAIIPMSMLDRADNGRGRSKMCCIRVRERSETDLSTIEGRSAVVARHIGVIHGSERGIGHGRLEVDAAGRRRRVEVVGSHGGLFLLRTGTDVGDVRVMLRRRVRVRWKMSLLMVGVLEVRMLRIERRRLARQVDAPGRIDGCVPLATREAAAVGRRTDCRKAGRLCVCGCSSLAGLDLRLLAGSVAAVGVAAGVDAVVASLLDAAVVVILKVHLTRQFSLTLEASDLGRLWIREWLAHGLR